MQTASMHAHAYKETRVKTASQGQIIVMLYDAAIRNIDQAVEKMDQGGRDLDMIHNSLARARDIVTELLCALDMEAGGDFAARMFSLYMWFNRQLMDADVQKSREPAVTVRDFMADLREAWARIADTPVVADRPAGGVNLAG